MPGRCQRASVAGGTPLPGTFCRCQGAGSIACFRLDPCDRGEGVPPAHRRHRSRARSPMPSPRSPAPTEGHRSTPALPRSWRARTPVRCLPGLPRPRREPPTWCRRRARYRRPCAALWRSQRAPRPDWRDPRYRLQPAMPSASVAIGLGGDTASSMESDKTVGSASGTARTHSGTPYDPTPDAGLSAELASRPPDSPLAIRFFST